MMPRPEPWVLAAAAACSAILIVFVAFEVMSAVRQWRLRRDAIGSLRRDAPGPKNTQNAPSLVRAESDGPQGAMGALAERVPHLWDLHHLLVQSGLDWTLGSFVTRVITVGMVFGILTAVVSGSPLIAAVAFVLTGSLPWFYARWKRKRRIFRLESQLPDAIDLVARAVRAGHPLPEGIRMASEEVPEPLASEFRLTFEEQKFGLPFEEALLGMGDRVEVVDIRILITAILVQREVGGNLTEILEQIAETMRARFNLKRQVRVYTAQGRMSGYTLAALPVFVGTMISLINPDYMQTLVLEPIGRALLVTAVTLQGIGFLWIRRIVDVRY